MKSSVKLEKRKFSRSRSENDQKRRKCKRKFLHYFPGGFYGTKYKAWERDYKWNAHVKWQELLNKKEYESLLSVKEYSFIAQSAIKLESKTNLLFSFEKMAVRDAIKDVQGAQIFAEGLYNYVYTKGNLKQRFENFTDALSLLPVQQTKVLSWPLQTVFGFIADPSHHIFLKPRVTQVAAKKYGFDFLYQSRPNWQTYESLLEFVALIREYISDLNPKDMIDIQSFIWVLGSDEYPD